MSVMVDVAEARLLALYEAALDIVPPLSRTIFLMHRVDDLGYAEIANRLTIDVATVEACMCEAMLLICAHVDGDPVEPRPSRVIGIADARLRDRHRRLCRRWTRQRRRQLRNLRWLCPGSIFAIIDRLAVQPGDYDRWLYRKRPRAPTE
ncbi:sigma factor-like helix-turn-helix DNA-binding protein [Hephaestia mangrovi]|uniref:sigma factor-like helix-turn-helix DNA-binding protein n=1 Tax=Hephaestia mangrovi TaxID=2873268 RepID=UPI001CA77012|nr:sigma factor-like helix-turn-helix DNA-binding protein [Hephaestia mangrovi]MBY8826586.1 hypothetical protein [Hephaestia mangrovi]